MMKTKTTLLLLLPILFILAGCSKEDKEKTGKLVFKTIKEMPGEKALAVAPFLKNNVSVSDVYLMRTINMRGTITEIHVSQGEVKAGNANNLTWYKIGENDELKYFDEYTFELDNLPVGVYQSIQMGLKNIWYRIAIHHSDPDNVVEMKETMGNNNCDDNETIIMDYFSNDGNHIIENGLFKLVSSGEKVGGFEILEGKVTTVYLKLGGASDVPISACTFEWLDNNSNGIWDCGIDRADNFECPPEVDVMFGFIVEYE
jgi:hypothetical protein